MFSKNLNARRTNSDQFEGRIIFMPMFSDIDWTKRGNSDLECQKSDHGKEFQRGHWSLILEMKKNGTEFATTSKKENWDQQPNKMMDVFAQGGHPVFRGTSALDRGTLKRKQGQNTFHDKADSEKH